MAVIPLNTANDPGISSKQTLSGTNKLRETHGSYLTLSFGLDAFGLSLNVIFICSF